MSSQPMDKVKQDTDRDFYLSPQQAVEYGIVDEILNRPSKEAAKEGKKKS